MLHNGIPKSFEDARPMRVEGEEGCSKDVASCFKNKDAEPGTTPDARKKIKCWHLSTNQKHAKQEKKKKRLMSWPGSDNRSLPDLLLVSDVLRSLGLLEGRRERGDGVVVRPALQSCGNDESFG